ncbi:hypothetical protein [Propionicicella superfundia]|uniref:hypothetical protein n=1 Tax=Propionicicella superfundia TaxID=348582 RepID=UPI0003F5F871|nr:hypothetical protein [Propionicicella superfundia]
MTARRFTGASFQGDGRLGLALALALTPTGRVVSPRFFRGYTAHPQALARALAALADVSATYFVSHTRAGFRDPILTAHGDRLRAEVFSACGGVYARLDLLGSGLDGEWIDRGTSNADMGLSMRMALARVEGSEFLQLDVGFDRHGVATLTGAARSRPVDMPRRWIRALGTAADMHRHLALAFTVNTARAQEFVAGLPAPDERGPSGWLMPSQSGVRVASRPSPDAVYVNGLHRLAALRRVLPHVHGMTVYGERDGLPGPMLIAVELPAARFVLGLSVESWRGHSGASPLLSESGAPVDSDDADLIGGELSFESVVDVQQVQQRTGLSEDRVHAGLSVLASAGRVGWDAHDGAYFHREVPPDPDPEEAGWP